MKKIIIASFAFVIASLAFQGVLEARVYQFKDIVQFNFLQEEFNPSTDHIIFRHGPEEAFPLVYKQRADGIEFKLDNGEGSQPRYTMLGKLPFQICPGSSHKMSKEKNVRGTLVNFECP